MRPILALVTTLVILGGTQAYLRLRAQYSPPPGREIQRPATGNFRIEVTLTFDAGGSDPFRVKTKPSPSLLLLLNGREKENEIHRRKESIPAGQTIVIEIEKDAAGKTFLEGANELLIKVVPQDLGALISRAVRVRISRDDQEIVDETLWSDPGKPVEKNLSITIPPAANASDSHPHP